MGNIIQGWGKKVRDKKRGGICFCDRTEMAYNYGDLVKEYEWRGNSLVWNGLMVGHDMEGLLNIKKKVSCHQTLGLNNKKFPQCRIKRL